MLFLPAPGKGSQLTVCWYHTLGLLMFIWASVHQHRCLVILANLRKNKSGKRFCHCVSLTVRPTHV